jgi:hypothetical protein
MGTSSRIPKWGLLELAAARFIVDDDFETAFNLPCAIMRIYSACALVPEAIIDIPIQYDGDEGHSFQ